jgi:hypothetical protein
MEARVGAPYDLQWTAMILGLRAEGTWWPSADVRRGVGLVRCGGGMAHVVLRGTSPLGLGRGRGLPSWWARGGCERACGGQL